MAKLDNAARGLIQDPIKRRAWIKYQIQMQGRSMAQVAAGVGVHRTALYLALIRPYPRMEKVISEAIGLTPQELFPERYDADGLPNRRMGRPAKSISKHTGRPTDRNSKAAQAS